MKENVDKSTSYEICRYVRPSPLPASQAVDSKARARRKAVSAKPFTYQDLLDIQDRLVAQGAVKPQTAANRASVLRAFLKQNNLELDDPVGQEFRSMFLSSVDGFVGKLRADGRSARNISNSLAALRPWRKLVVTLDTERAIAGDNLPPYNQALKSLLKEQAVEPIAKQLGSKRLAAAS
jgi:hypothetical protein